MPTPSVPPLSQSPVQRPPLLTVSRTQTLHSPRRLSRSGRSLLRTLAHHPFLTKHQLIDVTNLSERWIPISALHRQRLLAACLWRPDERPRAIRHYYVTKRGLQLLGELSSPDIEAYGTFVRTARVSAQNPCSGLRWAELLGLNAWAAWWLLEARRARYETEWLAAPIDADGKHFAPNGTFQVVVLIEDGTVWGATYLAAESGRTDADEAMRRPSVAPSSANRFLSSPHGGLCERGPDDAGRSRS